MSSCITRNQFFVRKRNEPISSGTTHLFQRNHHRRYVRIERLSSLLISRREFHLKKKATGKVGCMQLIWQEQNQRAWLTRKIMEKNEERIFHLSSRWRCCLHRVSARFRMGLRIRFRHSWFDKYLAIAHRSRSRKSYDTGQSPQVTEAHPTRRGSLFFSLVFVFQWKCRDRNEILRWWPRSINVACSITLCLSLCLLNKRFEITSKIQLTSL